MQQSLVLPIPAPLDDNSGGLMTKGILFGQAIGDALGLGCEFLDKSEIKEFYPNGYSNFEQMIQDKHRIRWAIGSWTDDTDQFLCILDSFLENGKELVPLDIASRLYNWFKNGGMGIGQHTYNVFSIPEYIIYPFKGSELAWKLSNKKSAPNGALMRNSAISLLYPSDLETSVSATIDVCKLTHFDPRCIDSCIIQTTLIHSLINNKSLTYQEVINNPNIKDQRTINYINENLTENIETLKLDESFGLGYTLKAISCALWAYFYAQSFEEGLLSIINEGGDADTNACIAGSVLGAKFGYDSIPSHWVDSLLKKDELIDRFNKL